MFYECYSILILYAHIYNKGIHTCIGKIDPNFIIVETFGEGRR